MTALRPSHLMIAASLCVISAPAAAEVRDIGFRDATRIEIGGARLRAGAGLPVVSKGRSSSFTTHRHARSGRSSVVNWGGGSGARYGTSGATGGGGIAVINITGGLPMGEDSFVEVDRERSPVRVVNVSGERLDHRPFGDEDVEIVRLGPAKIIRIAPRTALAPAKDDVVLPELEGGGFAALPPAERRVTVYPDTAAGSPPLATEENAVTVVPTPRPETAAETRTETETAARPAGPALEPWTAEWLRDCVARYPGFDASLGTYTDENGRRRFCTGEP